MARPDASPNARNARTTPSGTRQTDKPATPQPKGWPFAEGSQNHLDETGERWPRPASKPSSGWPERTK